MDIYVAKSNNAFPGHDLMSGIEHDEQDQAHIRYEKVGCVPGNEGCEALGKNDQNVEKQPVPREVWLEHGLIWQGISRDASRGKDVHEADMTTVDARPADKACHGRYIKKPVEYGTSIVRKIQESEKAEGCRYDDRVVWNATISGVPEERGSSALVGKTNEDTRSRIDVGVSG